MLTFPVLDWKYPFLGKFGQKNQHTLFKLKFGCLTNLNMQNSMMMFTFSVFDQGYHFWVNYSKNQNCQFSLKFGTQNNSNMQNSKVEFTISVFDRNSLFGQICSENSKLSLQPKIWIVMVTFPVLYWKYHFCANLVRKSKYSGLS